MGAQGSTKAERLAARLRRLTEQYDEALGAGDHLRAAHLTWLKRLVRHELARLEHEN